MELVDAFFSTGLATISGFSGSPAAYGKLRLPLEKALRHDKFYAVTGRRNRMRCGRWAFPLAKGLECDVSSHLTVEIRPGSSRW
jgi:hypothetical protein